MKTVTFLGTLALGFILGASIQGAYSKTAKASRSPAEVIPQQKDMGNGVTCYFDYVSPDNHTLTALSCVKQ